MNQKTKNAIITGAVIVAVVGGNRIYKSYFSNKPNDEKLIKKIQKEFRQKTVGLPISKEISKEFLTYENDKYGISIRYPDNWTKFQEEKKTLGGMTNIISFLAPKRYNSDTSPETFDIGTVPAGGFTLEEIVEASRVGVKKFFEDLGASNVELINPNKTTLAGLPAYQSKYNIDIEGGKETLQYLQVHTIKDNQAYMLGYMAEKSDYQKYLDQVKEMFDSFELTNKEK
ncbi:hypothetical protein ES703_88329 [subsurface metagenome]